VSIALAQRVTKLAASEATPTAVAKALRGSVAARTANAVREAVVLGLLWKPATHVVNITSNTLVPLISIAERNVARGISVARGQADGVAEGEAQALAQGYLAGMRAVLRLGEHSEAMLKRAKENIADIGKVDIRQHAITSENFGARPDSMWGKFIDLAGAFTRFPGVVLQAADDQFKAIGWWMELTAQSHRQAAREGAREGWDHERMARRMQELIENPPPEIKLEAANAALYQTFTNPSKGFASRGLTTLRKGSINPLFIWLPFIRTPMNLLSYTFERTPFAPIVRNFRDNVNRGGAARDLALARMATGTAFMTLLTDLAYQGYVQGALPGDRGMKEAFLRQGLPPDHLRLGDKAFRINRVDPFGIMASLTATMVQLWKAYEYDDEDEAEWSQIGAAILAGASDAVLDKTWFTGVSRLVNFMTSPDRSVQSFAEQTLASVLPSLVLMPTTLMTTLRDVSDETRPEASNVWEAVMGQIIFLQSRLPRRRTLWGKPIVIDRVNVLTHRQQRQRREDRSERQLPRRERQLPRVPEGVRSLRAARRERPQDRRRGSARRRQQDGAVGVLQQDRRRGPRQSARCDHPADRPRVSASRAVRDLDEPAQAT
jgi:hypothetical protein